MVLIAGQFAELNLDYSFLNAQLLYLNFINCFAWVLVGIVKDYRLLEDSYF